MLKFYVAGKWEDREAVRKIQNNLIAKGHQITVDWTKHEISDEGYPKQYSEDDINGVRDCDIYVGRFVDKLNYKGALVEMGAALAMRKPTFIIGRAIDSCVFKHHYLVKHFEDDNDFLNNF